MPLWVRDLASSQFKNPRFLSDPRGRCCTVHSFAPLANLSFINNSVSMTCLYSTTCIFSVNTKRYWFPCQNTWVLWDCYLYKQRHCEQNPVSFNTRECICKYGIEFINILLFADKGLNFKHLSSSESCPTSVLTDVLLNCLPIPIFLHPS